ncbi:kelch-like protein 7 [Oryzias latipes]|uniref:BTB domain-containing protein n=1 Tax=Oryzias latipes TaxID=8090 RepID=A0A3B3H4T8_ORYLA|nr:kelch-like protein 7 [Oryzias latipes]XP_020560114.1 kelch-like protein 7 [Oryzias latipes]
MASQSANRNGGTWTSDSKSYKLSSVVRTMNSFRKEGRLCDVTLVVQGNRFSAHRGILAAASHFFHLLFSTSMVESRTHEVELRDVSPDILQLVIGFIYTAQVSVDNQNVEALLYAADFFQIDPIKNVCVEFIKRQIDATNCLDVAVLADRANCPGLKAIAESILRRNFTRIWKTSRFLQLDVTTLTHLLRQEKLKVCGEEIYKAALHWLKHDLLSRKQHQVEVLRCIRFPLMSKSFLLKTVKAEPLITESMDCVNMLLDEFQINLLSPPDRLDLGVISRRRQLNSINRFAVFQTSIRPSCRFFNPKDDSWTEIRCSLQPRQGAVAVFWDGEVYILGGSCIIDCYNINRDFWYSKLGMLQPRSGLAACSTQGKIYTSGGVAQSEGSTALDLFESYDIISESWQVEASMLMPRCKHGSVEVKGLIYVCGGRSNDGRILNNCEVYNPTTKEWTELCSMREARKGHGLVVVGNRIFAVGGSGPEGRLRSVEYFKIGSSAWCSATPMPMPLGIHAMRCVAVGNVIYVLAEDSMFYRRNKILEYNVKNDRWGFNSKAKRFPFRDCLICAVRK